MLKFKGNASGWARIGAGDRKSAAMAIGTLLAAANPTPGLAAGDAAHGAKVYEDCKICHSIDKNEIGPMHRGVVGRKAATVAGYDYSAALKASNLVWDEATLEKWLTDPEKLVPGTKMTFSVDDAKDRADVIAFLKEKAGGKP